MKFLSLAFLSLTALIGAQSVPNNVLVGVEDLVEPAIDGRFLRNIRKSASTASDVVNKLDGLTTAFSSFSGVFDVDGIISDLREVTGEIEGFTDTIASVGQKRSYPVARNIVARTTFSDTDASQVVDAFTSFTAAEKKVMTAITADAPVIALAGQAQPMHDSLVKFQQANQALGTAMTTMVPTRAAAMERVVQEVQVTVVAVIQLILVDI